MPWKHTDFDKTTCQNQHAGISHALWLSSAMAAQHDHPARVQARNRCIMGARKLTGVLA